MSAKEAEILYKYADKPLAYVEDVLGAIADTWQENALNDLPSNHRLAIGTGHGVGKTAFVAWVIKWFIATRPNPQIVVTANTKSQLDTKTWRELGKWHSRALDAPLFEKIATRYYLKERPDTWFCASIPWSESRTEAFAGTHEEHVLIIFDEASAIADPIWEVVEGAMTTKGAYWVVAGNRTRNTGRFNECWGRFKHRWKTYDIDSRESKFSDKEQIQKWIEDYGEDSDFVRVRVKGLPPRAESNQFISEINRITAEGYEGSPLLLGFDVARFGDDQNVIVTRQGRRARVIRKWRGVDTMQSAAFGAEEIGNLKPDAVFVDGVGVGGGVVDRLKQLVDPSLIIEVNSGRPAKDKKKYFNKRAEMWDRVKAWLKAGADLPNDRELLSDLVSPEYHFSPKQQIIIEKKEDMKRRGLASPDCADALCLTFAEEILKEHPKTEENYDQPYQGTGSWMR